MCGCGIDSPCFGGCSCGCTHTGPKDVRYFRDRRGFVGGPNPDAHSVDARPVLVIDPEDREALDSLTKALVEALFAHGNVTCANNGIHPDTMQAALRSLLAPPKPEEPGKYGVVVAGDGREWFRYTTSEMTGHDWCRPGTRGETKYARWDDLEVLDVVHEGVQP